MDLGNPWRLGSHEEDAFEQIKNQSSKCPCHGLFQHIIYKRVTDAWPPVGLNDTVLEQQPEGDLRAIYYASCKLSNIDKMYAQFQRKALAV